MSRRKRGRHMGEVPGTRPAPRGESSYKMSDAQYDRWLAELDARYAWDELMSAEARLPKRDDYATVHDYLAAIEDWEAVRASDPTVVS